MLTLAFIIRNDRQVSNERIFQRLLTFIYAVFQTMQFCLLVCLYHLNFDFLSSLLSLFCYFSCSCQWFFKEFLISNIKFILFILYLSIAVATYYSMHACMHNVHCRLHILSYWHQFLLYNGCKLILLHILCKIKLMFLLK